jgi:hypothetical protein
MTLRTRDQADLVDAVVAFHLNAGVDFVLAVDHASVDGTAEILEGYERAGYLRLFREEGEAIRLRRSEMARLAATEYEADWLLHPDGDEFWWPRGGSWRELLDPVPERFGVVRGAWRHFAPRPDSDGYFAERLTVRVSPYAARTGPGDPFHPGVKVAHRAHRDASVVKGHDVVAPGLDVLRGWFPFEILHFPLRGREQARDKYERLSSGLAAGGLGVPPHVVRARDELDAGTWDATYDELVVDDRELARGLAEGTLASDTRLRDALRLLADTDELPLRPHFRLPAGGAPALPFARGGLAEETAYAVDLQVLQERESDVRAQTRIGALEGRLDVLERGLVRPIVRRLSRRGGQA